MDLFGKSKRLSQLENKYLKLYAKVSQLKDKVKDLENEIIKYHCEHNDLDLTRVEKMSQTTFYLECKKCGYTINKIKFTDDMTQDEFAEAIDVLNQMKDKILENLIENLSDN